MDIFGQGLSETAKKHLLETTRWTKLLAIMAFIFSALMLLVALLYLYANGNFHTSYAAGVTLGQTTYLVLIGAIYVYPAFALIKFSSLIKTGIQAGNADLLTEAFRYQKNLYRYMGILVIVIAVLIVVLMVARQMMTVTGSR